MQMIDFEYDGERASDYNLMIGFVDGNSNDEIDIGNKITINKVKAQNSDKYYAVNYSYDDCLTCEFGVIKNTCGDNDSFSDVEVNHILKWLNRKTYYKFKPIYDDDESFMDTYCEGVFNVNLIKIGTDVVGFKLTLNTNAPYCFCEPITYEFLPFDNVYLEDGDKVLVDELDYFLYINSEHDYMEFYDSYDNYSYTYCDVNIEMYEDGDFKLYNVHDTDNDIIINNCKAGEIINLYGKTKIIESSLHPKLYKDFNYNFLRVINKNGESMNEFHASVKSKITITYTPIRKVGIIL